MRGRLCFSALVFACLAAPVAFATATAQTFADYAPPLSTTAQTVGGQVGKRQEIAPLNTGKAPAERISSRLETRVQSRLQNRIDRSYAAPNSPTQALIASQRVLQVKPRPE